MANTAGRCSNLATSARLVLLWEPLESKSSPSTILGVLPQKTEDLIILLLSTPGHKSAPRACKTYCDCEKMRNAARSPSAALFDHAPFTSVFEVRRLGPISRTTPSSVKRTRRGQEEVFPTVSRHLERPAQEPFTHQARP